MVVSICHLIYLRVILQLGDVAAAAHGVAIQVEAIGYMPGGAFQIAASTMTGQYLGAGDLRRARHSVIMACAAGGHGDGRRRRRVLCRRRAALGLLPRRLQVERRCRSRSRSCTWSPSPCCRSSIMMVLIGALRGAGDTRWPLAITLLGFIVVRVPLAMYFVDSEFTIPLLGYTLHGLGLGVIGAWYAAIADITVRACCSPGASSTAAGSGSRCDEAAFDFGCRLALESHKRQFAKVNWLAGRAVVDVWHCKCVLERGNHVAGHAGVPGRCSIGLHTELIVSARDVFKSEAAVRLDTTAEMIRFEAINRVLIALHVLLKLFAFIGKSPLFPPNPDGVLILLRVHAKRKGNFGTGGHILRPRLKRGHRQPPVVAGLHVGGKCEPPHDLPTGLTKLDLRSFSRWEFCIGHVSGRPPRHAAAKPAHGGADHLAVAGHDALERKFAVRVGCRLVVKVDSRHIGRVGFIETRA